MKKIKRIALLVVAVLVLLVAASGVKTVLDMKNSADNEVQEDHDLLRSHHLIGFLGADLMIRRLA